LNAFIKHRVFTSCTHSTSQGSTGYQNVFTSFRCDSERWLELPIIPSGTNYHPDGRSLNYLCNELGGSVTVATCLQILEILEWCAKRCVDEPKCNGQLLTIVAKMKNLFFTFYFM
jgi:hypothetical protein